MIKKVLKSGKNGEDEVLVIINLSHQDIASVILNENISGTFRNLFSSEEKELSANSQYNLPAWNYLVYEKVK